MKTFLFALKNFILILVALLLEGILFPFGFLYSMFVNKNRGEYFRGIAESLDQLGNHVMKDLFNQWMLRVKPNPNPNGLDTEPYLFGNIDETVSSALGKNLRLGTLTKSGKFLNWVLNTADKNHSIDAIEENP